LPLLDLAPKGGYLAAPVAERAGRLLPYRFTLAAKAALSSLWPSSNQLPGSGRYPALCSVERGLSSILRPR